MGDMASLRAAKKDLRQSTRQGLSALSPDSIRLQSDNAVRTLLRMKEYQAAQRISVYLSMPAGEISTAGIVQDAMSQGKTVFVPYIHKPSQTDGQPSSIIDLLSLQSREDYNSLKPDKWGIPSLQGEAIDGRENCFGGNGVKETQASDHGVDLIVLPGMAFDRDFGRLGHGKGFYDYLLSRLQRKSDNGLIKMPFLVGLALNEQLLSRPVPMDATDWHLDALVTGDGALRCRAG